MITPTASRSTTWTESQPNVNQARIKHPGFFVELIRKVGRLDPMAMLSKLLGKSSMAIGLTPDRVFAPRAHENHFETTLGHWNLSVRNAIKLRHG